MMEKFNETDDEAKVSLMKFDAFDRNRVRRLRQMPRIKNLNQQQWQLFKELHRKVSSSSWRSERARCVYVVGIDGFSIA